MKIKGRFIAVLAAVGLLVALLPALPTGAVAGTITLKGADNKAATHFSANDGHNVVTIEVKDADLSKTRTGMARWGVSPAASIPGDTTLTLGAAVIAGEIDIADKFKGADANPPCDPDGTDTTQSAVRASDGGAGTGTANNGKIDQGEADAIYEALYDHDNDSGTDQRQVVACQEAGKNRGDAFWSNPTETTAANQTRVFSLRQIIRDKNGDGTVNKSDVKVTVDGVVIEAAKITLEDTGDYSGDTRTGSNTGNGYSHVKLTGVDPEDDKDENVVIEYQYSEYDFSAKQSTPLSRPGTEVRYGAIHQVPSTADPNTLVNSSTPFKNATSDLLTLGVDTTQGTVTVPDISDAADPDPTALVVTFKYDVASEQEGEKLVTVSTEASTSYDHELTLDGVEQGPATSLFKTTVVLFTVADYLAIDEAAAVDAVETIDDLDDATKAASKAISDDLMDRIEDEVIDHSDITLSPDSKADDLLKVILPASHGNQVTVRYNDQGSTISKSAIVDLEGPVVTLVSPTTKYVNQGAVTLSATMVDVDAGITEAAAKLAIPTDSTFNAANRVPELSGLKVVGYTVSQSTASGKDLPEGEHTWYADVTDKVGNPPDSAVLGSKEKPYKLYVDTSGPELRRGVAGMTGRGLKNPGVESGANAESDVPMSEWVRLDLELGKGKAPVDPATVTTSDFRVDGVEPVDVQVSAIDHGSGESMRPAGGSIYLHVGEMATDARPTVVLTGEIMDEAGNVRSSGTSTRFTDGIAPRITVTPSAELSDTEVVITVAASESLERAPKVYLQTSNPRGDESRGTTGTAVEVNRVVGAATPTWTHTKKVSSKEVGLFYVVVTANDRAGVKGTAGLGIAGDSTKNVITFEVDKRAPGLKFVNATGGDLKESKNSPEAGAVWVVAQFDDDEYTDDSYRDVTLTAMSLTDSEGTVVADLDSASPFAGKDAACQDHATGSTAADVDKCSTHTLAINLTAGTYTVSATGVDAVNNSVSDSVTFKVIARKPFKLNLNPGSNLVSIPGNPVGDGGNLNVMFEDHAGVSVVSTYDRAADLEGGSAWLRSTRDPETGLFVGDISTLQPGKAYFITSDARVTVNVLIQPVGVEVPPSYPVRFGYNLVGVTVLSGETSLDMDAYLKGVPWTRAYWYDPTPGEGFQLITPENTDKMDAVAGRGYWVYSQYDSTITP